MKLVLSILSTLFILSCSLPPVDDSPLWASSNRYATEMINDCNLTNHTLGLNGCAFKEGVYGRLVLPPIWKGNIELYSEYCGKYNFTVDEVNDFSILLKDIYQTDFGKNCSFSVTRTIMDLNGQMLDGQIIGRFFIKKIPNERYYELAKFSIGSNSFIGTGWYQKKYDVIPKLATFYPRGTKGSAVVNCGETEVAYIEYNTNNFTWEIPKGENCDYEISLTNADNKALEFASIMVEENLYTLDLSLPTVTYKKSVGKREIEFSFDQDINGKHDKVVYGVKINNTTCKGTYKCRAAQGLVEYKVKGITLGGRVFMGVYNTTTNSWKVWE